MDFVDPRSRDGRVREADGTTEEACEVWKQHHGKNLVDALFLRSPSQPRFFI